MDVKLLFLTTVTLLSIYCVTSNPLEIRRPYKTPKIPEGEVCRTHNVEKGVCTRQENCDQAFLHSSPFEDHGKVCMHNAGYRVLCCTSFVNFCKRENGTDHILYGQDALPNSFPHIARIGKYDEGKVSWLCSASIISDQFLLTAAHCHPAKVAGLGCNSETGCDQIINFKKFVPYPEYRRSSNYHDIALVHLEKAVTFRRSVLPICPHHGTGDLPESVVLMASGWGATEVELTSNTLKYTTLQTVPIEKCKKEYNGEAISSLIKSKLNNGISNEIYCAKGTYIETAQEFTDTCKGDSGGPLQANVGEQTSLIAIISTGFGCGSELPGIYIRVASYFDWLSRTIETTTFQQ